MKMHTKSILYLKTLVSYILCFIVSIFLFIPILILVAILPQKKRLQSTLIYTLLDFLYWGILKAMFIPVSIEGAEHLSHQQQSIFVANHESTLDIPALGMLMHGHPHLWYVFDRFAKTPVLGFFVRRMTVIVDQSSPRQSAIALLQGIRMTTRYKLHTLLFPEGSRFIDGKIHDFSKGFAMLARRSGQPVIPVLLYNFGKIYPAGSFLIHAQPVKILVGTPMKFQESDTEEIFTNRVQQWFVEHK